MGKPGCLVSVGNYSTYALEIKHVHISHTVDDSKIRRSPVEVGSLSTIIYTFFSHPRWCRISEPSTVAMENGTFV